MTIPGRAISWYKTDKRNTDKEVQAVFIVSYQHYRVDLVSEMGK